MTIDTGKSFGTRECPSCATEVAANHNRCPICHYEFPARTPMKQTRVFAALLMLIILLIGLLRLL